MEDFINNLRERPHHERKRIAFVVSFGVTAVIFAFWISSFGPVTTPTHTGVAHVVSPFESVKNNLASAFDSIVRKGSELNSNQQTIEVIPGNKAK